MISTRRGGPATPRTVPSALSVLIAGMLLPGIVAAITPGRAWGPQTRLFLPDHAYLPAPRLMIDPGGTPRLVVAANDANADTALGFAWAGDQWVVRWRIGREIYPGQVLSPGGEGCQIWLDFALVPGDVFGTLGRLLLACAPADGAPTIDSVATVNNHAEDFSAVVGSGQRWVAVDAPIYGVPGDELRLYLSRVPNQWERVPAVGRAVYGVTVGELNDASALVVWSDLADGMHWGVADGSGLVEKGFLTAFAPWPFVPNNPQLRPRPSGGFWLSWGPNDPGAGIARFTNGSWSAPGRLS